MKTLDTFMSRILPHVPACPDVVAQEALLDAAIEFCEKTLVVRQTLSVLGTTANTMEYTLSAPAGEAVVAPIQAWFKGRLLEPVAADLIGNVQAFNTSPVEVTVTKAGPTHFYWTAPSKIGLYPVPDDTEASTLTVRAALKPTRTATQLEDVLYDDWIDALMAGALSRLHAMKDQPWASADRSLIRAREFRNSVQRARAEGTTGRVRASLYVRQRGF
jgi:hypothetical protein